MFVDHSRDEFCALVSCVCVLHGATHAVEYTEDFPAVRHRAATVTEAPVAIQLWCREMVILQCQVHRLGLLADGAISLDKLTFCSNTSHMTCE